MYIKFGDKTKNRQIKITVKLTTYTVCASMHMCVCVCACACFLMCTYVFVCGSDIIEDNYLSIFRVLRHISGACFKLQYLLSVTTMCTVKVWCVIILVLFTCIRIVAPSFWSAQWNIHQWLFTSTKIATQIIPISHYSLTKRYACMYVCVI